MKELRSTVNGLRLGCAVMAGILCIGCSTTSNLPEGEVLYTGISEIAYDHEAVGIYKKQRKAQAEDSTGVITSVMHAYQAVDAALTGASLAELLSKTKDTDGKELTNEEKDSLEQARLVLEETTATVKAEVEATLAYAPNNGLLGSSYVRFPLQFGLWTYNAYAGDTTKFGKWMFNTFAATPRYVSTCNPQLRTQIARNTLRNFGFFRGQVKYEVQPNPKDSRQAKVAYSVYPGPLWRLGSIEYQHFAGMADSIVRRSMPDSYLHSGDPFSATQLDAERSRLSEAFQNRGYYFVRPEHITFRADTVNNPFIANLQVRPASDVAPQVLNRFYLGRTRITVMPYEDYLITDSLERGDYRMRWSGGTQKPPVRLSTMRGYLFYQRGRSYNKKISELTADKLTGMGIFSNVQITYSPRDTTASCDSLDIDIFAILDKPWDSEFEAKVTNKSNNLLGPGLSYGLTKRNAFRGAETVKFKIFGSYEWQLGAANAETEDSHLINAFELGTSLTLSYPRIKFFGLARRMNQRAEGSTNFSLSADWLNRSSYFQMLTINGGITYTYQPRRSIKHEFTPFRLDYSNLLRQSAKFDALMLDNPVLAISMREQLVPAMSYTLTLTQRKGPRLPGFVNTNADAHGARTFIINVKEAGNITDAIYAAAGRSWGERDKRLLGLPFAQYVKATAEWRESFPLTPRSSIVARAFAGVLWSIGNSTTGPYSDLFSIGGANSLRAFTIRSIGPGGYHPAESGWSYINQVGDLKLEANVEYRFPIVASLYGALFVDAGNVWLLKEDEARPGATLGKDFAKQIALGTGLGLRYDLDFLVLRLDVGVGIHAPYDTGKTSYYNMTNFWRSLGWHIAVGYPF